MNISLQQASLNEIQLVAGLAQKYQSFEGFECTESERLKAIECLLKSPDLGRIYLIKSEAVVVGYIAICMSYSLEFGGMDAFIDEFFIDAPQRGLGIGSQVLEMVKDKSRSLKIRALHLEVAHNNQQAQKLYHKQGFKQRDQYSLMTCVLS
ncbi:GNAT family N-acetyltransferase [Marinicella sp. W31]|uniref:GNAT family N-acetyltransferase n=1 Tax=Marinicella sp. W31 TaxID=3023713 RepID=UPI003757BF15